MPTPAMSPIAAPGGTQPIEGAGALAAYLDAAMAPNTVAAYRSDWRRFETWCLAHHEQPMPASPALVARYLAEAASQPGVAKRWRYAPLTLARWVAGIDKAHEAAGFVGPGASPQVKAVLAGVRRSRATPPGRKAPLLMDDVERIVAGLPRSGWPVAVAARRDRALLVLGWVGAFRRSELAGLAMSDVTLHPEDGLHVRLRHSKTDQEAQGMVRALPYARRRPLLCAPCAFLAWAACVAGWDGTDGGPGGRPGVMRALRDAALEDGAHLCSRRPVVSAVRRAAEAAPGAALFRAVAGNGALGQALGGHGVNAVVKRRAETTGLDPAQLGGHSLRAGFVTQAFRSGADAHSIMRQTGHRNPAMLEVYSREGAPLTGNAVMGLGL
jgi:integrase